MIPVMALPAHRRYTYEEYLELEEASETKNEFFEGTILAMAGGTAEHSLLKTNLLVAVAVALRGRPCRAFDADLRSLVEEADFATYPDVSVACGPFVRSERDPNALTNPTVLFEVLSPGTAAYDLGQKFDQYAKLPSLQEYVVIDSERVMARVFRREGEKWSIHGVPANGQLDLESLGIRIAMVDIYDGWEELRATRPLPRRRPRRKPSP